MFPWNARGIRRASIVAGSAAVAVAAAALSPVTAQAAPAAPGRLSSAQASSLAQGKRTGVIVMLKNQHADTPATKNKVQARKSLVKRDQSPFLAELKQVKAANVKTYSLINGFAAQVTAAEAARLAADPTVASVTPDRVIPRPTQAAGTGRAQSHRQGQGREGRTPPPACALPTRPSRCSSPRRCSSATPPTPTPASRRPASWPPVRVSRSRSWPTASTSTTRTSSGRTAARLHRLPELHRCRRCDRRRRGLRRRVLDRGAGQARSTTCPPTPRPTPRSPRAATSASGAWRPTSPSSA